MPNGDGTGPAGRQGRGCGHPGSGAGLRLRFRQKSWARWSAALEDEPAEWIRQAERLEAEAARIRQLLNRTRPESSP